MNNSFTALDPNSASIWADNLVCSWGRGEDGQLGHGDAEERHLPTIISGLCDAEISSITCGSDHTTAYSNLTKTLYSWGWGDFGRLGHGNLIDLFIPHPVRALNGLEIKHMACGDSHCIVLTSNGEVLSWGRNQNGQLGLGHKEDSLIPCKVQALEGKAVKMLAAGAEHTAAVTESGKLYGWGWGQYGNLGLGDRCDQMVPVEVVAVNIAGGWRHTVALDEDGQMYGWGWNKFGQVGVNNTEDQNYPQIVKGLVDQRVTQVSCGWRHTVALTDRGNIYSWGRGTSGQLGHGDAVDINEPKRMELLSVDGLACWQIECSQPDNATGGRFSSVPSTDDQVAATRIPACDYVEPNKMLIGVCKKTQP
ncbi:hypothetical protein BDL97_16G015700 [Sphagnum fallax]|nr:hypothetical protein BDL97_16G015700 [Sphagnum fallax]